METKPDRMSARDIFFNRESNEQKKLQECVQLIHILFRNEIKDSLQENDVLDEIC